MKIEATFRGDAAPFEGDLELPLRALPADSYVLSAQAVVRPVNEPDSRLFEDTASLPDGEVGGFGVTKERAPDGSWASADFHARRNLVSAAVSASAGISAVRVQVDLGGLWAPIHRDGSIANPPIAGQLDFNIENGRIVLPNVATSRIKINRIGDTGFVNLTSVTWLSFPSNVSLRVQGQGPFWFQIGELRSAAATPDFSESLRAHLPEAEAENGHVVVPLTLHSDSLARIEVALELEVLRLQSLSPPGIDEVVLPFEYDPLPETDGELLKAAFPANAKVVPKITSARAVGVFEPSRIVHGASAPLSVSQAVAVSPGSSQAQPIEVAQDLAADAFDLLLEPLSRTAKLSVNLLDDVNGKPWGEPLLSRQVDFELDREVAPGPNWVSASLPGEYQFKAKMPDGRPRRYWLVVSSSEGEASWAVQPFSNGAVGLHHSRDGGLSWQESRVQTQPANGILRLRRTPDRFDVPIQLRVGAGDLAEAVSLDDFSPLGRVDFTLDFDGVADAFNRYLAAAAPKTCSTAEHLVNGDFQRWIALPGTDINLPEDWELTSGFLVLGESQDAIPAVVLGSSTQATGLSQIVPVGGGCLYQFEFLGESTTERAQGEVIWLSEQCGEVKTDGVSIAATDFFETAGVPGLSGTLRLHRVRLEAPPEASQAEIRFTVPANHQAMVGAVSLRATAEAVVNADLRETTDEGRLKDWSLSPEEPNPGDLLHVETVAGGVRIENVSANEELTLRQRREVSPGFVCRLEFQGRTIVGSSESAPRLEIGWLDANAASVAESAVQTLESVGFDRILLEAVAPPNAAQVETSLAMPAGSQLQVRRISLLAQQPTAVPMTFVSQAPGELSVLSGRVAYDIVQPSAPTPPPVGPCRATPPGKKPGERPEDCCHCCCCQAEHVMVGPQDTATTGGRTAVLGTCRNCGGSMVFIGGARNPNARILPVVERRRGPAPQPLVESPLRLIEIRGIKEKRAARLTEHGLGSVELLATADPRKVAEALRFVSPRTAAGFVRQAKKMVDSLK